MTKADSVHSTLRNDCIDEKLQVREKMGNSKSAKLSPEIEARIAKVAGMTLVEVRTLALSVMDELTAGSIAARDAAAIQRAIDRRIKALVGIASL